MGNYQYAYLLGNVLIAFPIWLFLFWRRKDLRREILLISVITGCLGPISELWYLRDYWQPELFNGWPIGLEDYLFGFFVGGIAGSIYEEIFGRHFAKRKKRKNHWCLLILPVIVVGLFFNHILIFSYGLNSIYASSITYIAIALFILIYRRDLWVDSIASGLISGVIFFLAYMIFIPLFPEVIQRWWKLGNISGILLIGVPIEELMWAFSWGLVIGPAYEFFAGRRLAK